MEGRDKTKYFLWLLKRAGLDSEDIRKYRILFKQLFNIDFYYSLERDEDRLLDGLELRKDFDYIFENSEVGSSDKPCSVLEVLVALALRMEGIMGDPTDEHPEYWFWIMVNNLGLMGYFNDVFTPETAKIVDEKVDIFLSRSYEKSGKNGLFPVKKVTKDQRKIEIWYQMQAFLSEN